MSIIDGMYWENRIRVVDKSETIQTEWVQGKFNKQTPCSNCDINDICKYAFSIKIKDYNEDIFDISVTCKRNKIKK